MAMDQKMPLSPAPVDLQFQLSLLRLMYPKTGTNPGASVQVAELERLQQPGRATLAVKPAN